LNERLRDDEQAHPMIARPVSLAGRWETDVDASGIVDGLLLTLSTAVIDGIDRLASLTIGVYRREAGEESFRYFIANEGPVTWDGARLRIIFDGGRTRSPLDIDLTFDEPRARWTGTFGRNRDVRTVELRRPGAFKRLSATTRLVGDWCGPGFGVFQRCIRLRQGSDGVFLGWLDQCCDGVTRYGWLLRISLMPPDSLELTLVASGGNKHGFAGWLSPDGTSIDGYWLFNDAPRPATTLRRADVADTLRAPKR
jgi:hypothetical protein